MLEHQGFCGDGTYATLAEQLREGNEEVDGENDEFAHWGERYHDRSSAQDCTAQADSLILRIRHPQVTYR